MSTTTRTDVHRPSALVTEDYEFVACGDYGTSGEPGYAPLAHEPHMHLLDEGWKFDGVSGGGCDHCGARVRYYAILKHLPTHSLIRVGQQCLGNRFDLATDEFHARRKAAQLDRERQRIVKTRAVWMAIHAPDAETAYEWADAQVCDGDYGYEGMRHKFVANVNRYGSVSDKFLRAIMRDMVRTERREAEREAEQATLTPVVEGKGQVTGEVVSTKLHENDFGSRWVMTVKDDRGFLVWGTVPAALGGVEKGDRVTFSATVTKSDRDDTFGFFKRPTKAEWLDEAVVA
jgi:hypothetical protein